MDEYQFIGKLFRFHTDTSDDPEAELGPNINPLKHKRPDLALLNLQKDPATFEAAKVRYEYLMEERKKFGRALEVTGAVFGLVGIFIFAFILIFILFVFLNIQATPPVVVNAGNPSSSGLTNEEEHLQPYQSDPPPPPPWRTAASGKTRFLVPFPAS